MPASLKNCTQGHGRSAETDLSAPMREALNLFVADLKRDPAQTALRMRALQSMSEGVSIEVIQLILDATARAKSTTVLDENLRAFLSAQAAFAAACEKFKGQRAA